MVYFVFRAPWHLGNEVVIFDADKCVGILKNADESHLYYLQTSNVSVSLIE